MSRAAGPAVGGDDEVVGTSLDGMLAEHAARRPDDDALLLPAPGYGWTEPWLGDRAVRRVSFARLERRVGEAAARLRGRGIGPGTRVALLVPPIEDFFVLAYALLRVRAVPVVVDPGIGLRRVKACLDEAAPAVFLGVPRAHLARRLFRWCPEARGRVRGKGGDSPTEHAQGGAIVFTSGSTGPPKGVVHTAEAFVAQAMLIRELYGLGPGDVSLATFPPFALFGPALGMTTVVPRMDPTRPAAVKAARLVRAVQRSGATTMFGSPAVLDRLGRGAPAGTSLPTLRTVVSAGAPVPRDVQRRVLALLGPDAQVHTPYGATEALPVATIGSDELLALPDDGICVGRPVAGVDVTLMRVVDGPVTALSDDLRVAPGEVGEVVVRGPVVSRAYAERPVATAAAKLEWDGELAHRMGDLGSFDDDGRLWFAGRVTHVVPTAGGPLYSVPCEEVLNHDPAVRRTALVGVGDGPERTPVFVVELVPGQTASDDLRDRLLARAAADPRTRGITTLLVHGGLPVDPRHNSKIDRPALARWAQDRVPA